MEYYLNWSLNSPSATGIVSSNSYSHTSAYHLRTDSLFEHDISCDVDDQIVCCVVCRIMASYPRKDLCPYQATAIWPTAQSL